MPTFENQKEKSLITELLYYLFDKVMTTLNGWKSGISQILRRMAEKWRKCGIIPPKAEWLACLQK